MHLIFGRGRVWVQFNHFFEILNSTLCFSYAAENGVMLVGIVNGFILEVPGAE